MSIVKCQWMVYQLCCKYVGGLHSSPLEKIVWVSNLCPILVFPSVKCICLCHFQARTPLIMFFAISFIVDKVLYAMSTSASIYNFINVPLLSAILSNNGFSGDTRCVSYSDGVAARIG